MSNINTNNINANYPVPGVNNSTQGFRDNFTSIKTNLDTAATEITQLQNAVVVKTAIANTAINNDMANTLISNAAVRGFRSTTYNLGTNLTGNVVVNVMNADVQYGSITANTTLQFNGWANATTQSNLQLQLTFANTNATVTFPTNVIVSNNWGSLLIENANTVTGALQITPPAGVGRLEYMLSTTDCGGNIMITPINRPQKATQLVQRTPVNIGQPGDFAGAICYDASFMYVCVANYDGATAIWRRVALAAY